MAKQPQRKPLYRLPRHSNDNDPQRGYCSVCGAGFVEYMACEMPDCNFVKESGDNSK